MLNINDLYVGRVDATQYGYAHGTLKVTIDVEIKQDDQTRETTGHEAITNPLSFSMSAAVWNQRETDHVAGGQAREVLGELVTFADGFDAAKASQLAALWERWHLNTMRAGCAHVESVYTTDQYSRRVPDLDNTPECPQERYTSKPDGSDRKLNHYRYGSAWLTEPLPEGFEDMVRANLPRGTHPLDEENERMRSGALSLSDMMRRDGIKISATKAAHRLDGTDTDGTRWRVSFRRPGAERSLGVTYHMGSAYEGRKPTGTEVLSCVLDEARTFRNAKGGTDLASDFGIELDEAKKLYRKLEIQEAGVRRFLGDKYEEYIGLI